jgi:hypothetical protein
VRQGYADSLAEGDRSRATLATLPPHRLHEGGRGHAHPAHRASVGDFEAWKRDGFDAHTIGRAKAGVRTHRISRDADDPNYVLVELEFRTLPKAEAMRAALRNLWRNPLVQIARSAAENPGRDWVARWVETKEPTEHVRSALEMRDERAQGGDARIGPHGRLRSPVAFRPRS